jgi:putative FmdB family regulatory protein
MPRYDYRCVPCDTSFEITRPINVRTTVACPTCGTEATRIFSPVGVVFKGSGFHSTDYRSDKGRPSAESSAESSPASPLCNGGESPACATCPAAAE